MRQSILTALSRAGRACKRPRLGAAEGGARGKPAARSVQQRGAAKKKASISSAHDHSREGSRAGAWLGLSQSFMRPIC
jgi:hypothetical protein